MISNLKVCSEHPETASLYFLFQAIRLMPPTPAVAVALALAVAVAFTGGPDLDSVSFETSFRSPFGDSFCPSLNGVLAWEGRLFRGGGGRI